MEIVIRNIQPKDEEAMVDICYITGGEDLKQTFKDPYLFGLHFCLYYVWYEKENSFVAVDKETGKVVGYIICSLDSLTQRKLFKKRMESKIRERLQTLRSSLKAHIIARFIIRKPMLPRKKRILKEYPAHLHINLLPEYQRKGIGTRMMQRLEKHLIDQSIPGYHLEVDPHNRKGIPFYYKYGLTLLLRRKIALSFGKKFET